MKVVKLEWVDNFPTSEQRDLGNYVAQSNRVTLECLQQMWHVQNAIKQEKLEFPVK